MTIGKRLFDLARGELNDLLDKAASLGGRDDDASSGEGADGVDDEYGTLPRDRGTAARRRPDGQVDLASLSDAELTAEIERRKREREAQAKGHPRAAGARASHAPGEHAAGPSAAAERAGHTRAEGSGRGGTQGHDGRAHGPGSSRGGARAAAPAGRTELHRAYAALEVPAGSDFETVRKAYRNLMRKYHPDRHAQSAEKQKAATELAQRLTEAYKVLERHLRK
jgi:hypothetical protein